MTLALSTVAGHGGSVLTFVSIAFIVGMAISTQSMILAKRRFFHAATIDAAAYQIAITLFSWLSQQMRNPDLQVVEFSALSNTDQVIANAACSLYAIILKKTTATASYSKGTDHATTCSTDGTQDLSLKMADTNGQLVLFPRGRACANGWTMRGNTTGTGNTTSGANGAAGVVLLGA